MSWKFYPRILQLLILYAQCTSYEALIIDQRHPYPWNRIKNERNRWKTETVFIKKMKETVYSSQILWVMFLWPLDTSLINMKETVLNKIYSRPPVVGIDFLHDHINERHKYFLLNFYFWIDQTVERSCGGVPYIHYVLTHPNRSSIVARISKTDSVYLNGHRIVIARPGVCLELGTPHMFNFAIWWVCQLVLQIVTLCLLHERKTWK
jgi:hypothetical protein